MLDFGGDTLQLQPSTSYHPSVQSDIASTTNFSPTDLVFTSGAGTVGAATAAIDTAHLGAAAHLGDACGPADAGHPTGTRRPGDAGGLLARLRTALSAPVLKVTRVPDADRPMMRAAVARVGNAELAHAAVEALARRCRLLTTRARDVRALGLADWQIIAIDDPDA